MKISKAIWCTDEGFDGVEKERDGMGFERMYEMGDYGKRTNS